MVTLNATEVRKEWSSVIDEAVHEKPVIIKRTRDRMMLSNIETIITILDRYSFHAVRFTEEDGSVTLSLDEIDLVENAPTEEEARRCLAESILEYAKEYYENYSVWSHAPNRRGHIPYVLKALVTDDAAALEESIRCRDGRN